jgi:hypothetical protein
LDSTDNGPAGAASPPRRHAALVEGRPAHVLAVSTVPLAGALVVLFGIQLAEAWLTGLLGATALAALGFAFPVVMTAMSFGIGLGAGASAVVARALGAGSPGSRAGRAMRWCWPARSRWRWPCPAGSARRGCSARWGRKARCMPRRSATSGYGSLARHRCWWAWSR